MDGDIVILEETSSTRKEMFHYGVKVSSQNNVVLICPTKGISGPKACQ